MILKTKTASLVSKNVDLCEWILYHAALKQNKIPWTCINGSYIILPSLADNGASRQFILRKTDNHKLLVIPDIVKKKQNSLRMGTAKQSLTGIKILITINTNKTTSTNKILDIF